MIEEFRHCLLKTFAGLPIFEFGYTEASDLPEGGLPPDVAAWAWRIAVQDWEGPGLRDVYPLLLDVVDTTRIRAFIVGNWNCDLDMEESAAVMTAPLIEAADRFPALEALFVGDMESEQNEVSWIHQSDPGPLLAAFPRLRQFGLRGGTDLTLEPFRHAQLEELTFQAGGLPPQVVRALGTCDLPALTGLELYLGSRWYSGGATAEDIEGILSGSAFPVLKHLGLRDAENADEIAAAVAQAPIVARLESLDLSLGNLSDEGAAALLAGQPLTHLKTLDLHHHYLSDAMIERLREALPGVILNVDEQENEEAAEDERYIAVSE